MIRLLSHVHSFLGKSHSTRWLKRVIPLQLLGRAWLRSKVLRSELPRPDDITILIGVRNRADYRLVNALKSIACQSAPANQVHTIVVDYGSRLSYADQTARICREYNADYVFVEGTSVWSRSRCLNTGIRLANTKYLLASDVDILLSPNYLSDAIDTLAQFPLSVVCSAMRDLPRQLAATLERSAETGEDLRFEKWKTHCVLRHNWELHPSIAMAYTALFRLVGGYDEYYTGWGCEDLDLMRRFQYLGLQPRPAGCKSFYLHQWHPKHEGVPEEGLANWIAHNRAYFKYHHSILRNGFELGNPFGKMRGVD